MIGLLARGSSAVLWVGYGPAQRGTLAGMLFLLLSGCLLAMDRPPKCPSACPGNFQCTAEGECPSSCSSAADCADGYYCDDIFETCEAVCVDAQCPDHLTCDGDTGCKYLCERNADCQPGYACVSYECEARP